MTDQEREAEDEAERVAQEAMDEGVRALEATSAKLLAAVEELGAKLRTTQKIQDALERQQEEIKQAQAATKSQGRVLVWLAVSVVLDIVLSMAVTIGYFRIDHNAQRINEIQNRTSSEVLCPLYQLLVDQIATIDLDKLTPEERARVEKQIPVIEAGYAALRCEPV